MALVGDPARFAIEFEVEPAPDPEAAPWMFGRTRWWCGGTAVGRYEPHTVLPDVTRALELILTGEPDRTRRPDLLELPAADVARIVGQALYADSERSDAQIAADGSHYGPFFVSPRTSTFDLWDVFVVEGLRSARLMWCPVGSAEIGECELRPGEFAGVLAGFLQAIRSGEYGGDPCGQTAVHLASGPGDANRRGGGESGLA
ncbi:Imm42 family immunity protein [Nocardia stercoris]|nr:Imm42 family immunity protein [Nocardia stercoris]